MGLYMEEAELKAVMVASPQKRVCGPKGSAL